MKRGFTLIELLVVISILGILASLVITRIAEHEDHSKPEKSVVSEINTTQFPTTKKSAAGTITEAWFDETDGRVLWVKSSDGDLVAIPSGKSLELLKKLIRRGRNP